MVQKHSFLDSLVEGCCELWGLLAVEGCWLPTENSKFWVVDEKIAPLPSDSIEKLNTRHQLCTTEIQPSTWMANDNSKAYAINKKY